MLSSLVKRVVKGTTRTADVKPELYARLSEVGTKNVKINSSIVTGNKEHFAAKNVDDGAFIDEGYNNWPGLSTDEKKLLLDADANHQNLTASLDIEEGTMFKTGSKQNEIAQFGRDIDGVNKKFQESDATTTGIAKLKSAISNQIDNKGKKAIVLPADNTIDLDSVMGLPKERKAIDDAMKRPNSDEYLSYDGEGVNDGFIQNNTKMMDYTSSPDVMGNQLSSFYSSKIGQTRTSYSIVTAPADMKITGTEAAIKHVDYLLDDVYPKLKNKDMQFRRDMTQKEFLGKLEETKASLLLQYEGLHKIKNAKESLSNHNGAQLGQTFDEIKIIDGKLSDTGIAVTDYIKDEVAGVFANQLKRHTTPPGVSPKRVQAVAADFVKASYIFSATGTKGTFKEIVKKAYALDKTLFTSLGDEEVISFLAKSLKYDENFMTKAFQRVDNIEIQILNKKEINKMAINDFSISKKITKEIEDSTADSLINYKMSHETGFDGRPKDKLQPKLIDLESLTGRGRVSSGALVGKETLDNANKLIRDGFFSDTTTRVKEFMPSLAKFFKNNGASDKVTGALSMINRFNNKLGSITKGVTYMGQKHSVFSDGKFIGGFATKNLDLAPRDKALYKQLVDFNTSMKKQLVDATYFSDREAVNFGGSIVNKSKQRMITKQDFKTATDTLNKNMKDGNLKKAIEDTMAELDPEGEHLTKWTRVLDDVIDPLGAEVRLSKQLGQALIQSEYGKMLTRSGDVMFQKAPGFSKVSRSGMNTKILEDLFGTSNIYMPDEQVKHLSRTIKEFGGIYSQTAKEMVKEFSFAGLSDFARHAALMFPFTRVMVDSGNMISAWAQLGISPTNFVKHYKGYYAARKGLTEEYQAFINSGVASQSGMSSVVNQGGKDFGKQGRNTFLQKINVFNRNSDVSQMAYSHMLDTPDEMFRYMSWKELSAQGMGTEDIIKVIDGTLGISDNAPKIVKQFANIPGGDVFATYSYMMTRNLMQIMSNNPKQFLKVAAYATAFQQASVYMFLNKEERANLKQTDQAWMKPGIFNSLRIDPSFATPGGKYNIINYHSPWMTDLGGLEDSIHPVGIALKTAFTQQDVGQAVEKSVKAFRKTNRAVDFMENGEYARAVTQNVATQRQL